MKDTVQKKANLFIVGAMKAGTTSLINMLGQHPRIYTPPVKEPHYFINDMPKSLYSPSKYFNLDNYLSKEFPRPLHIANFKTLNQYEKNYSLAKEDHKYLTDGSTLYLHSDESAKLIYNYNPNAKIVILTRDPVKRAYSHYKMNVELGREARSFNECIREEIEGYKKGTLNKYGYINMSNYKEGINRFKGYFNNNVYISDIKEFESNKKSFFIDFLKIPDTHFTLSKSNKSRTIRNRKLQSIIYKSGLKDVGSRLLPKKIRKLILNVLTKQNSFSDIPLSEELQKEFKLIVE